MKRDKLEPDRYEYLSVADSTLYDLATAGKVSLTEACITIKGLLEDKAKASRIAHCASTY